MEKTLIYVRVLQQDTQDQIRIGVSIPILSSEIEKCAANTVLSYDKKLEWCGGFQAGCKKYYKRIALVDANTLQSIKEIYPEKEEK